MIELRGFEIYREAAAVFSRKSRQKYRSHYHRHFDAAIALEKGASTLDRNFTRTTPITCLLLYSFEAAAPARTCVFEKSSFLGTSWHVFSFPSCPRESGYSAWLDGANLNERAAND